jgi:hypothetical protein
MAYVQDTFPDGDVVHTVGVVTGTVVGGVYTVVGATVVTGALGARVVVVIPGLGTVVGVAVTALVVVVMGTVEPL